MRRALNWIILTMVCLWVGVGLLLSGSGGDAQAKATRSAPSHLLVYAQEWSLWPSRTKVPAGIVDVQFWNRGQDAHDVRIRRLNAAGMMTGPVLAGVSVTPAGGIHTAVWHLKVGHYELYCSLPGHLMMGMHAKIVVTAASDH